MKIFFFKKPKKMRESFLVGITFVLLFSLIIISQVKNVYFSSESVSAEPKKESFVTLTPMAELKGEHMIYIDGEEYKILQGKTTVDITKRCTFEIFSLANEPAEVKIDLSDGLTLIPDAEKIEIKKGINYIGRIIPTN